MEIVLNGDAMRVDSAITVAQLLQHIGMTERRVAVEVNRTIVPRSQHERHTLDAGDRVEIVHAIGGG